MALPLGLSLLWACFNDKCHHDDTNPLLQHWLTQQVVTAYTETYGNVDDINIENPVRRLGLVPQGNGDQVNMIEIDVAEDENAAAVMASAGSAVGGVSSDVVGPLLAHQMTVQRQIEEVKGQVIQHLFEMKTQHQKQ